MTDQREPYRIVPTKDLGVHEWERLEANYKAMGYDYDSTLVVFALRENTPRVTPDKTTDS